MLSLLLINTFCDPLILYNFYDTFAKHYGGLEKNEGHWNVKWQFMMAKYEIVEFIAIMQHLIGKFTICIYTETFSKKRNYKENLSYMFVSYF